MGVIDLIRGHKDAEEARRAAIAQAGSPHKDDNDSRMAKVPWQRVASHPHTTHSSHSDTHALHGNPVLYRCATS